MICHKLLKDAVKLLVRYMQFSNPQLHYKAFV